MTSISATGAVGANCGPREAGAPRQLPDEVVSALADKLGMSKDDLAAKLSASGDPRQTLDELAEEQGVSRQELRETFRAAMPQRPDGAQGGHGGPPPPPPPSGNDALLALDEETEQTLLTALADAMDISAEDLKSEIASGTDLRDILKEHGVSHEEARAAFQTAFSSWQSYGASGAASSAHTPAYNAVDVQL